MEINLVDQNFNIELKKIPVNNSHILTLTQVQERAVNELVNGFDENQKNKTIEFKAPTGSGKTFMIANVIDRINNLCNLRHQKVIYIVVTLSTANLTKQIETNFNNYQESIPTLPKAQFIDSPSNSEIKKNDESDQFFNLENNKIYIFGISSFGKNRIFTERGVLDSFLEEAKNQNYKLVYIRDEAHYGGYKKAVDYEDNKTETNIVDSKAHFEYKIQQKADYIIKMTATPKGKGVKQVLITEDELHSDAVQLLKKDMVFNKGIENRTLEDKNNFDYDDNELLNIACLEFKKIKEKYNDIENEPSLKYINPAMLIQVTNKTKLNEKEFEDKIENYLKIINKNHLSYVVYFSDNKNNIKKMQSSSRIDFSLSEISKNNCPIDVIIFKIGPSVGWNIPRACMLVQLRDVTSTTLNKQTLGRIKRNPNPNFIGDDQNSIKWKYFVYSTKKEDIREIESYTLRNEYEKENFVYGTIDKKFFKDQLSAKYKKKYIEKLYELISYKEIKEKNQNYRQYYLQGKSVDKNFGNKADSNKEHFLIGQEKIIKNNQITSFWIERKIKNNIELEIFNLEKMQKYKNIIGLETLRSLYATISAKERCDISFQMFCYIVFRDYIVEIQKIRREIINKFKRENNKSEFQLKKEGKALPLFHYVYADVKKDGFVKIDEVETNYAYVNSIQNDEHSHKHFFDSKTELEFAKRLQTILMSDNEVKRKINIWTKNPVFNGIKFEYYDQENNIVNSYPDFVLNINQHEVAIEVKSLINDYDPEKSKIIGDTFKEYLHSNRENKIIDEHKDLTLVVCYFDKDKIKYKFVGASTNQKINENLNKNSLNLEVLIYLLKQNT